MWSLGCLVYEMCCLVPPFTASNPLQLARRIERGEWEEGKVRERYGDEMCAMIRGMLCVDVRRRWGVDDVLRVVKPKINAAVKREERKEAEAGADKQRVRERAKLRDVTNERQTVDGEKKSREAEAMLAEKEARLKEWEERLNQREKQQAAREQQLKDRERAVVQMEKDVNERAGATDAGGDEAAGEAVDTHIVAFVPRRRRRPTCRCPPMSRCRPLCRRRACRRHCLWKGGHRTGRR